MGHTLVQRVGRYELLIELGRGGMAELWLGRLRGIGGFTKLVAIKRILPHLAQDRVFADMFLNEGRIAAQLSHPNVCHVHELGEADGELYLAMEYLEGAAWNELVPLLPRGDTAALRFVAGVIAQACEGLHYAHELHDINGDPTPIVHRDVSPHNLFVTLDGTCKVLDFGIAKMMKDGPRTRTGVLKGKLPYMSPEQIQAEALDARSDVWALGVVLWEALAGTTLFDRDSDFLVWKAITEADVPSLTAYGYPQVIDDVVRRALARDKAMRFHSARELGETLRYAVDEFGGAYTQGEIAGVVRSLRGTELKERQRAVASAVATFETPASTDFAEVTAGASMQMRAETVAPAREPRKAWPIVLGALAVAALIGGGAYVATTRGAATVPTSIDAAIVRAPIDAQIVAAIPLDAAPIIDAPAPAIELEPVPAKPTHAKRPALKEIKKKPEVPPASDEVGFVSVDATPYATIYLGATKLGVTPLRAKVPAGKQTLRAVTQDGRAKSFSVTVAPGKTANAGMISW